MKNYGLHAKERIKVRKISIPKKEKKKNCGPANHNSIKNRSVNYIFLRSLMD
jgi:hypothetical protein